MGELFLNERTTFTGSRTFVAERLFKITPGQFNEKSTHSLSSVAQLRSQYQIGTFGFVSASE